MENGEWKMENGGSGARQLRPFAISPLLRLERFTRLFHKIIHYPFSILH